MTNTEPVAWVKSSEWDDAKKKRQSFNGWRQNYGDCDIRLYHESALLAERERADEAEKREMSRYQQYSALLERHEKQTAELAALKEQVEAETARLDWLAEHGCAVRRVNNGRSNLISWLGKDRLRKAIDRARSQS